jgi:hypothetical protein
MTPIRAAVDRALRDRAAKSGIAGGWGSPLTDDEWSLLMSREVGRFERGERMLEELVDGIFDARRTYLGKARLRRGARNPRRDRTSAEETLRAAMSDAFVAHLERSTDDRFQVRKFREDILQNTLVDDVDTWLQRQVRDQGPPTVEHGRVRLLRIRVRGEHLARATRVGHALDWLRRISEALAAFYQWDVTDATMYALTGERPAVRSLTADVRLTAPVLARSRIVLTIAPTATPPEVAALYSRERARAFGRVRRLSAKHASLAAFVLGRDGETDRELMDAWNRTYAKRRWRYTYPSVFRREADLAMNSLLEMRPHRAGR